MRSPRPRVTVVALATAVTLTGCGPATATARRVTDYAGIDREFQAAKTGLALPPGVAWPAHEERPGPDAGPDPRYEIGGGTVDAQLYWMCAWAREWLTVHRTDPARTAIAVAELDKVGQSYLYAHGLDATWQRHVTAAVTGAQVGDPEPVVRVATDCADFLKQT
jgi:hypothetical protein